MDADPEGLFFYTPEELYGIVVKDGSSVSVKNNNTITNRLVGIYLENLTDASIFDNTISTVRSRDRDNGDITGCGIVAVNSSGISMRRNSISSANYSGIYLSSSHSNTISDNTIGTGYDSVKNETVYGLTSAGDTGPLYLGNSNILDCSLYIDIGGEWVKLEEWTDYTLNYDTGEIDTSAIEPFDAGWTFYAYYNYTGGNGYGIYSINSDSTIANNTIIANEEDGIYINDGGDYSLNSRIENNTIADNHQGINIFNGSATVINNHIMNNAFSGIYLQSSNNNTILSNKLSNNPYGFYLNSSDENDIIGNTISNNTDYNTAQQGIYLTDISSLNHIEGNNITWNLRGGIYLDGISHSNRILNNNIAHNQGGSGINAYNSPGTVIEGNLIFDNNRGVYLSQSGVTEIFGNNITENYYAGIYLEEHSSAEIYNNSITNNTADISNPGIETGIHILNSDNIWIHDNALIWNVIGIYASNSNNITVESNTIIEGPVRSINGWAIPTLGIHSLSSQMTITGNSIYGSTYAIRIENSGADTVIHENTIQRTEINNQIMMATVGIYLINASSVVEANTIEAGSIGILVADSLNSTISGNVLSVEFGVGDGICVENSTGVTVEYNNASACIGNGLYVYHSELMVNANEFWSNGQDGIFMTGGTNATLSNNTVWDNSPWDIHVVGDDSVSIAGGNIYIIGDDNIVIENNNTYYSLTVES